jgi:hypothetical protein
MSSRKIGYMGKPHWDGYVLNPPKNDDCCVLSSYTSSHVPFIRNFGSITPLFSDHMPNIGLMDNNGVTLLKPGTKDTQVLA